MVAIRYCASVPVHLNLIVADVDRSEKFYRRWFGFDRGRREFPDGTVFIRDAEGTDLAFVAGDPPEPPAPCVHFGFRRDLPAEVSDLLDAMRRQEVPIVEHFDEPDIVTFKCTDPDGYVVEIYWEP